MSSLGIAFLGTGDVATLHAAAVASCPGATLRGAWNRTRATAERRAREFGCRVYPDPEALVHDPRVDAVFVLTNMETHREYAELALAAGKHVLVEKPTAASVADIEAMQRAAGAAGVCCMPVHNYIYEPGIRRTRALIDAGKLGDLVSVYVLYNIHHPEEVARRYPGVIRHIMTHHAYILLYLAGAPEAVSAMRATINDGTVPQENVAMATLRMQCGALGHLCASFAADDHAGDPWTCLIKVIGTKGATRFSYRDWVENRPAQVHSQTYSAYPASIENTVHHFIERCLQRGEEPLSTLDDAISCQRIVEACERSADEGRHVLLARGQ